MSANVFITGVSSGIGQALVAEYLQAGDSVWGVSRRAPKGTLLQHPEFYFRQLDLTCTSAVRPCLDDLLGGCRSLDTVILNAGAIGRVADMADISIEEIQSIMDINVWANKSVLDVLFEKQISIGRVIGVSSGAAVRGKRGWNGYAISKAALNMLIQLYAREHSDIWFGAVAPGLVDTPMQEFLCGHPQDSRFDSLDYLRSQRGTDQMLLAPQAAARLKQLFDQIETSMESGGFIDIRKIED